MTHDNQAQPTGGWYAALAGAIVGAGLAAWWLLAGSAVSTDVSKNAVTAQPTLWTVPAPTARSKTGPAATQAVAAPALTTAAGPAPVRYVTQWMDGGRQTVVLAYQGRNVVVQVPGSVDGRYEVVSASEREVVLRDLASATTQRVAARGATSAADATARTAAATPDGETEETPAVRVRPAKLPPPSKRTSDDLEPEN